MSRKKFETFKRILFLFEKNLTANMILKSIHTQRLVATRLSKEQSNDVMFVSRAILPFFRGDSSVFSRRFFHINNHYGNQQLNAWSNGSTGLCALHKLASIEKFYLNFKACVASFQNLIFHNKMSLNRSNLS